MEMGPHEVPPYLRLFYNVSTNFSKSKGGGRGVAGVTFYSKKKNHIEAPICYSDIQFEDDICWYSFSSCLCLPCMNILSSNSIHGVYCENISHIRQPDIDRHRLFQN